MNKESIVFRWVSRISMVQSLVLFVALLQTGHNLDALVATIMAASLLLDLALFIPGLIRVVYDGRIMTAETDILAKELVDEGQKSKVLPVWWGWQETVVLLLANAYAIYTRPSLVFIGLFGVALKSCHIIKSLHDR